MPAALAAPLIIGGLTAGGAVAGSAISAHAAGSAADKQAQSAQNALDYTKQAEAPYLNLGSTSIAKLMDGLNNGTFGPGSLPQFEAPTLEQAEQTPGYQFTQEQGNLGITRGQAAAGGAFTGGTLKALDSFNTGLANSTYNDAFNRTMQTYQAGLAKQAQEYQELVTPVTIGANAASGTSTNVGNLMTQIGNAQAAGTVGTANAIQGGISGVSNSLLNGFLLNQLFPQAPSPVTALPITDPTSTAGGGNYNSVVGLPAGVGAPG